MLINLHDLIQKYQLKINGCIHVGGHWAEEHEDYLKEGIRDIYYIEPCIEAFKIMVKRVSGLDIDTHSDGVIVATAVGYPRAVFHGGVAFINCACGDSRDISVMYVSHNNQGQSNSLLKPGLHIEQHPEVVFNDAEAVPVYELDFLISAKSSPNMLVMDVQGYEGHVLRGATETLKRIDVIYTEVNRGQTYEGNMEIEEMDEYLKKFGFERVETFWPSPNWTWGDAVYLKK
jgi:FkbM family methyltransferase